MTAAAAFAAVLSLTAAAASAVHTPPAGSPERKAILDAVRKPVQKALGGPVAFQVVALNVQGDWAFVMTEPQAPWGGRINPKTTRLYAARPQDALNGLHTEAVLRKTPKGVWRVVEHQIGSTDVWYMPYCDAAPKGVIPHCP